LADYIVVLLSRWRITLLSMTNNERTLMGPGEKVPRIRVSVTREQIEQAKQADSGHCMIADAIKATIPDAKAVTVDLASIRWTDSRRGVRYLYLTPPSVQIALLRFDNGITPPSFHFRLNSPAQVVASGRGASHKQEGLQRLTSNPNEVPSRIGGKLPENGALSDKQPRKRANNFPTNPDDVRQGRRRAFGVRSMARTPEDIGKVIAAEQDIALGSG